MPPISVETFVNNLQKSRLLNEAQLSLLRQQLRGNPLKTRALADVLINQKHLTPWQAKQLLRGETGFVLQQYHLQAPVGRGGMGHVFKGKDTVSGGTVAVKVMARKLTSNQALVSRFRREIRANAKLDCPHIVKSLDAGRVGKVDFMVMEYVNGDQVDRISSVLGRVPVDLSCEIVRQAAMGLQHAHRHGMVHRDIKPGNLMIHWTEDGDGIVKLMDMGLVLLTAEDSNENTVTRAGQVMGTPDFMSPEQGWDTTKVDIRSDIYSLGCTLYRLLTGTVPFSGTNPLQVLSQRLQRDAPSVQTICDDIPDDVAAIVTRMTLRDPDARYQHPEEVAKALAGVSTRLTRKSMKVAARKATNDPNANADFGKGSENEVDESDGTYQQFLKEVEEGSVVDLMLASDETAVPAIETVPLLDINVTTGIPRPSERRSPRRGQKFSFVVMAISAIVLAIVTAIVLSGGNEDKPTPRITPDFPTVIVPTFDLKTSQVEPATTGRTWTHQLQYDVSPSNDDVRFSLAASAPPGMTISDTGQLEWSVPNHQTAAEYSIGFVVNHHAGNGTPAELYKGEVSVEVRLGFTSIRLPDFTQFVQIPPTETAQVSVATPEDVSDLFEIRYRIEGPAPAGIEIDELTGVISWIPTLRDMGRHEITVAAFEEKQPDLKLTTQVRLLVRPTSISHVLPDIPKQEAKAGSLFTLQIPSPVLRRPGRAAGFCIYSLAAGAPPGLDLSQNTLKWKIPDDARGIVNVPLTASLLSRPDGGRLPLNGIGIVRIDVSEASGRPVVKSSMPAEEDIKNSLADLRKTLGRQLAQARTTTTRAELSNRLLEQADSSPSGPDDAALLRLVQEDLAEKARATDALLRIAEIRHDRYNVEPTEAVQNAIDTVRRSVLSPRQLDTTIERSLKWAQFFLNEEDYKTTASLLKTVILLSGRNVRGPAKMLADDVAQAQELAESLDQKSTEAADQLKVTELNRLLDKWQFDSLFPTNGSIGFVQFSPEGTPPIFADGGRSLWALSADRIRLRSETIPVSVGLVDNSREYSRFVLRFELSSASNSASIMFGVTGTDNSNFTTFRMVMNASGPGRIQSLRPIANISEPTDAPMWYVDQTNLVEMAVDGNSVVGRVNGMLVSRSTIPGLPEGKIGFLSDLQVTSPEMEILNPRVLILPAD